MLDKFRSWYLKNQVEITWALIGFLVATAVASFSKGEWGNMTFSLVLAFANYYLLKK